MDNRVRNSIIVYLLLTFVGSSFFYIQAFQGATVEQVALPLMFVPASAALITQFIFYHTLAGLGWRLGAPRYLVIALLIPLGYCLLIYVPVWLIGLGGFNSDAFRSALTTLPVVLVLSMVTALGEEIGWRGFLTPAFYRFRGFAWAGLATGVIWGLWHVPLIVGSNYNAGTPPWYAVSCFMVSVTGISVMLAWLRLMSGSVWPAVVYHGAHNAIIQTVFDASTVDTGSTVWITSEFGIGLAVAAVALAIYFWRRQGEIPDTANAVSQ